MRHGANASIWELRCGKEEVVIRVLGIVIAVAFYIWFLIDVAQTPKSNVRNLPKVVWLLIVFALPLLGGIIWLLTGRPRSSRRRKSTAAPDDDPKFLAKLAEDEWRRKMRERRGETS